MSKDYNRYSGYIESSGTTKGFIYALEPEKRQSAPLQPVKQDNGQNPYEIRPEIGDWFSQGDFSLGQGQQFFHRKGSDYRKFYYADGFDIAQMRKPGSNVDLHLVHCKKNATYSSGLALGQGLIVADGSLFTWNGGSGFAAIRIDALGSAHATEDASAGEGGPATLGGYATDGSRLFVSLGAAGVHMRTDAGVWDHWQPDGATDLSVGDTYGILWHRQRLFVAGNGGRSLYEVVSSSTPAATDTLPAGWIIRKLWTNGQWVYAACENSAGGAAEIRHYEYNSTTGAFALKGITPMFDGELIWSAAAAAGHMLIGGFRTISSGRVGLVYRAIPNDQGFLQLVKIAEGPYTAGRNETVYEMIAVGGHIIITWPIGSSSDFGARYGLAVYDLAREAFSLYMKEGTSATSPAAGVALFGGTLAWHNSDGRIHYEDLTKYTGTATFISSVADWNAPGAIKQWDRIEVSHSALAAGESVAVYYSTKHPKYNTWTLAGTSDTDGATGAVFTLSTPVESRGLSIKIVSTCSTDETSAPEISGFTVRSSLSTPDANREWVFARKILLKRELRKKNGTQAVSMNPRTERDWLENLLYKTVTFYEPDQTWTARVEQVSTEQKLDPNYVHDESNKEEWEVTLLLRGVKA